MTKKFTLLQLFSIVDGRLSTDIGDVYEILNHVTGDDLMTHHLPVAMKYVKLKNPEWFNRVASEIDNLKEFAGNDFTDLMEVMKMPENEALYDIPQLRDEVDASDFHDYMIDNSLLLKKFG